MYLAVWLAERVGFWAAVPLAAGVVAVIGFLCEFLLLRKIYKAPELLQLLATFALLLIFKDFALWAWGPEDLLGPRAPGFTGAVQIAGGAFPQYDLLLILLGPLVLVFLQLILSKTRWGILVRAATGDREMAGALGINQRWLFTGVFALGALLAGLGGALQIPREPANLNVDLSVISDAFVVVVVGGLGSIPGAFLAALLIAEAKAFCIGLGYSEATLVIEFAIMAIVLVLRPWGLLGRMPVPARTPGLADAPLGVPGRNLRIGGALLLAVLATIPLFSAGYTLVLLTDILAFALFAVSLHFLMGPGGLYSFGHAAYFGIGAYAAGILFLNKIAAMEFALALAPLAAGLAALAFGWFCVRLSGVYSAMLTLAFAQIAWSAAFQWNALTGGSNGMVGVWPAAWLSSKTAYYYLTLLLCSATILLLWRAFFLRHALRAARSRRCRGIGIDARALGRSRGGLSPGALPHLQGSSRPGRNRRS
jgi:branched-chain amino acid transport system permease protein